SLGEEDGLVVAPLPLPIAMDRHRYEEIAASSDRAPATRERITQNVRQPPLARVLQLVERAPDHALERRAPIHLDQRRRDVAGQTEEHAARAIQMAEETRSARGTDGPRLGPAAGTAGREREIEQPATGSTQAEDRNRGSSRHGHTLPTSAHLGRIRDFTV